MVSLEAKVGSCLAERGWRLAVAESCSGGLLTYRLTSVPGASRYVEEGIVCYSDAAKTRLLGVPARLVRSHGAVSEPVAQAMAEAVRRRAGTEIGVAITGLAGPGRAPSGSGATPVGLVYAAVASPRGTTCRRDLFRGRREDIQYQATQAALLLLRQCLMPPTKRGGVATSHGGTARGRRG